jgi:hypothetical protein
MTSSRAPGLPLFTTNLANDSGEAENLLAQVLISLDLNLSPSRATIHAFGEKPPRQRLRYGHSGSYSSSWTIYEIPSSRSTRQTPFPATFAGNLQKNHRSGRRVNITVKMRQSTDETI